jgi:hypothetical protein
MSAALGRASKKRRTATFSAGADRHAPNAARKFLPGDENSSANGETSVRRRYLRGSTRLRQIALNFSYVFIGRPSWPKRKVRFQRRLPCDLLVLLSAKDKWVGTGRGRRLFVGVG